jgi:hypothetical protein
MRPRNSEPREVSGLKLKSHSTKVSIGKSRMRTYAKGWGKKKEESSQYQQSGC